MDYARIGMALQFEHRHGNRWVPMQEHDAAEDDPERGWVRGDRIISCTTCDEQIRVSQGTAEQPERER
jgi:hypothetical protein